MRTFLILALLVGFALTPCVQAQTPDADSVKVDESTPAVDTAGAVQTPAAVQATAPSQSQKKSKPIYFGATVGLSFGDYFRISIAPLIGYSLTPKVSIGARAVYEYIEDKRYPPTFTASNYGASGFARFRPIPKFYAHGELAYMSYEYATSSSTSDRDWIPFLLLGGGFVQPISPKASAFVEVLFDVLQDDKSPYGNWDPWVRVGVAAGF